jgi:hypothetical protein
MSGRSRVETLGSSRQTANVRTRQPEFTDGGQPQPRRPAGVDDTRTLRGECPGPSATKGLRNGQAAPHHVLPLPPCPPRREVARCRMRDPGDSILRARQSTETTRDRVRRLRRIDLQPQGAVRRGRGCLNHFGSAPPGTLVGVPVGMARPTAWAGVRLTGVEPDHQARHQKNHDRQDDEPDHRPIVESDTGTRSTFARRATARHRGQRQAATPASRDL